MVVQDVAGLIKILEKSGLIKGEALDQVKEEAQALGEKLDKPEKLARYWIQKGTVTRWQAAQLLNGKAAFFLGKYKLLKLIGGGGMGRVFLAEHTIMNRKVALKVISKEYCDDPAAVKRFQAEARAIATLNHPNIVQAYNFESEGNRYYIVMEYVDGESLEERVKRTGPLPIEEVIAYTRQAAKALRHAHDRKMIHCDIKPANLLVNDKDQLKILDMGIARLQETSKSQMIKNNTSPEVLGTVDFMAPEMAINSPDIDLRADIYSLGCTIYYLLTGSVPYPSATLTERILDHQESAPRDPRELRPDTPDELAELCLKMEAKLPEDRFQSMQEALTALNEFFPDNNELSISDSSELPTAVSETSMGADSSSSGNQAWSGSLEAKQEQKTDAKPGSQSFDLTSSQEISTSGANETGEIARSKPASAGGKRSGSRKKGSVKAAKPAFKLAIPAFLSQMSGRTKLIIGSSVLGAILLFGIIFGIISLLGGDSDKPRVADNQPAAPLLVKKLAPTTIADLPDLDAPSGTPAPTAGAVADDPVAAASTATTTAPAGDSQTPTAEGTPAEGTPVEGAPAAAQTAPAEGDPAAAPAELTEEEKAKQAEEEAKKKAEEEEKKKAEEEANKKAEEEKAKKAEEEAKAKADAEAKKKADEEAKQKAEAAKKAAEELFKSAPKNLEEPLDLKTNEEKILLTIDTPEPWTLSLLGGSSCGMKNFTYAIEQTEQDPAKAEWIIKETAPGKGGESTVSDVARVWREDTALKFKFAEGASPKSAGAISNTILQIDAIGKTHKLTMRKPFVVTDSGFDFFKKGLQIKSEVKDPPANLDNVKFSFIGIEGFDKEKKDFVIEPETPPSLTDKTRPVLKFVYMAQGNNITYPFGIEAMVNPKNLSIKFGLSAPAPVASGFQMYAKNKVALNMKKMDAEKKLSALANQEKDAKGDKTKIHTEMEQINSFIWAFNFMEKVEMAPPKLQFEIYNEVDGEKIILVTTQE